jgi:glycosyltransferase involved in cell wall biosynthesis
MIGTRGVPAAYGGFETAVEEVGRRLAARGHPVTVYCRNTAKNPSRSYLGMTLVHLPALRIKAAETLSHTALSVCHAVTRRGPSVAILFNAANAPFLPLLRARRVPTAVHVDGLEWLRGKWGAAGRRYYRAAERLSVRLSDALIADSGGIADYYADTFGVPTELLSYGATILRQPGTDRLRELGLEPRRFHLVVARFEPENHVDMIVDAYRASSCSYPLVVVGSAPYAHSYTHRIEASAAGDPRIWMLGSVWDQEQLDQLYANALTYVHGHSVGGTNPSLLRAMGGGTPVLAYDVVFNREVLGADGGYFGSPAALQLLFDDAERSALRLLRIGQRLQRRAYTNYDWDAVALGYEELVERLAAGYSIHPLSSRAPRRTAVAAAHQTYARLTTPSQSPN